MNVFAQPLSILWAAEVMRELKTSGNVWAGNVGEKAEAWQHNLASFFQPPKLKKKRNKKFVDLQERRSASVFLRALHNMLLTGAGINLRDFASQQSGATPAPSAASQGPRAAAQDPEPAEEEMLALGGGKGSVRAMPDAPDADVVIAEEVIAEVDKMELESRPEVSGGSDAVTAPEVATEAEGSVRAMPDAPDADVVIAEEVIAEVDEMEFESRPEVSVDEVAAEQMALGGSKPDEEMLAWDGSERDEEMPVLLGCGESDSGSDDEMYAWGSGKPDSESEDEMPVPQEEEPDDEEAGRTAEEAIRVLSEQEHSFWYMGPFWATHTMGDVKDALWAMGWDAKPLQKTGPLHWKVEAVSNPPSRRIQTMDKRETLTVHEHPNLEDASGDGEREEREANVTMAARCPSAPEMIVVMDEGSINFSVMWYLLFQKKFRLMVLRDPCHRSEGVAPAKHIVLIWVCCLWG
jgi:hypothetical protein